jgi:predicted dinucleotide-binding enzyme
LAKAVVPLLSISTSGPVLVTVPVAAALSVLTSVGAQANIVVAVTNNKTIFFILKVFGY